MDIDNKLLERDIENAIRARGLKLQMQQWDNEAKGKRREGNEVNEQKITPWHKIRRTIYSLSAVAAVAAILIVAVPTSTWYRTYHQLTRWGYRQYAHYFSKPQPKQQVVYENSVETLMAMAMPSVRQIADGYQEKEILGHENPMHEATWQIMKGRYAVAQSLLEEHVQSLDAEGDSFQSIMDDIVYLSALCELGQNNRSKALKALDAIAKSNSKHSQAAAILVVDIR